MEIDEAEMTEMIRGFLAKKHHRKISAPSPGPWSDLAEIFIGSLFSHHDPSAKFSRR